MPRKQLNFPRRSKRKELLQSLQAQLNDPQFAQDQKYKAYVDSWVALDQKMEALSAEDENGLPKLLDDKDADELAEFMLRVGNAGEEFLAAAEWNDKKNTAGAQLAEQFQTFLAKDFSAVKNYDPAKKQLSLAEIQENARTRTIDLRGRNLGSMSNLQNERIPMTLVDAKGNGRPGVFTKPNYVRVKARYFELIEKAKAACGNPNDPDPAKAEAAQQSRQKLDNYLEAFKSANANVLSTQSGKKLTLNSSDDLTVGFLIRNLDNTYSEPLKPDHAMIELNVVGIPEADKIPKAALKILADGFTELKEDIGADINAYQLELKDGDRLDNRNAAMTAVCDALGMKDLVARSESMKFIGENGEETEGTFMEFAKGYDLSKKPKLFEHVAMNPYGTIDNRNKLFKQISDMQVLDYLCLNKDRHQGNVFYEVDDMGRITGIQGIDNDSSFGPARWPKSEVGRLGVITQSTAEKIKAMADTPEQLRFVLRGRGLSRDEINAAVGRLNDLQDGIEKGKVKVVPDDQIGRRDIKEYYPKSKNAGNLFKQLDEYLTKQIKLHRDPDKPFKPMPKQTKPELGEVASADRQGTVAGLTDSLGKVSRLVRNKENDFNVDKLTKTFRGSSQYFKDMVTAAKASAALQRRLLEDQDLDKSKLVGEEGTVVTLQEVNESFETLQKRAEEYLQYKLDHSKARPKPKNMDELRGKNDYEQSHIDYARNILKTVAEYQKSMSRPQTEAEKESRQANQERRELENRRSGKAQNNPEQGPAAHA